MRPAKNKPAGFTLIELLVVVSIISLLSSVVLASLNTARAKARDAKRMQDLVQLRTAINMYFNDNGTYPPSYGSPWGGVNTAPCGTNGGTSGATAYVQGLVPTYMPVLPIDPRSRSTCDGYLYQSNGSNYKLLVNATPELYHPSAGQAFYDPIRPGITWMVCSGEPACSTW